MTDNRTTELLQGAEGGGRMSTTDVLRKLLDERGVKYVIGHDQKGTSAVETTYFEHDGKSAEFMAWVDTDHTKLTAYDLTPEQAIAATLGSEPPYDELLRCLENDWNISASWDGLRKFWCVELTEEGVRIRDAHDEALLRIAALEELVWFMMPFFGSACSHECGCPDDYFEPHGCDDGCKALKELNERMKELGLEVGE